MQSIYYLYNTYLADTFKLYDKDDNGHLDSKVTSGILFYMSYMYILIFLFNATLLIPIVAYLGSN